ncbi:MAG: hypothetical protein ABIG45_07295 [Bacillota bacterium]
MSLNAYRDEAGSFLKAIHALDEPLETKISMLQQELDILRNTQPEDGQAIGHQVYDLLFLLMEIASQRSVDLDAEWASGWARKAKKYLSRD